MHNEMGVGDFLMNLFDLLNSQNIPCRRPRKFVGTVTGSDCDGQSIAPGLLDEIRGLFRICQ